MKKYIAFFLILMFSLKVMAATTSTTTISTTPPSGVDADTMTDEEKEQFKLSFGYEPYGSSEFPDWLHKVRRAEVISLGATALTFPILNIVFSSTNTTFSNNDTLDFLAKFGIAAGAGLVIAIIDLIIGEVQGS